MKMPHNPIPVRERCWCASTQRILVHELSWNETYETQTGSKRVLPIPGRDLAGVVVEVGPGVSTLLEGAEVYAMLGYSRDGAEADYTSALPGELAPKPRTLDAVQAAAVPLSAPPRLAGAFVIATASTRNREFLHKLGADEVIDYTTTRFEDVVQGVDLVFDTVGGDPCNAPGR